MSPRRKPGDSGAEEQRLRGEVDRMRRENGKLKKAATQPAAPQPEPVDLERLRAEVAELTATKQRLARLYFSQVEENRKRARKLHQVLESVGVINSDLDLDVLLQRLAETIRTLLGFRVVLIRIREPGTSLLKARAFAGIDESARGALAAEDVQVETFLSWLRDEFRVGRSYFISHTHGFNDSLPHGYRPELGNREDWEWHPDDVLLVPLFNRDNELVAYFSVDDPADRLVPSSETVELLEIFGHHAVIAIDNARLYGRLERQTHELREAGQRMQELHALRSNFVSTISHELRTPLTAIRAYLDTLLNLGDATPPADQLRHFLGIINEESHRLSRLIDSLLDLNRFDSGEIRSDRKPVDLAELVAEAHELLEPVAQAGQLDLKVIVEAADTTVDADRDQMKQLLLHLGSNAIKVTPAGGRVSQTLRDDPRDVTLEVRDSGIGIPEHALEKVFERFYQVDSSLARRFGGTGVGLAICKSIVEWHGGRLHVASQSGQGSCFTVVLPRRVPPRVAVRPGGRASGSEDLLKLAIEMVAEVMNARVVSLLVPQEDGDLVVKAAVGLDDRVVREARIQPGVGVAGWVAQHRRPLCMSPGDGRPGDAPGASGRSQYRSGTFLSVPLESSHGFIGVLNVTDPAGHEAFEAEDCHMLLHLAERVAAAWDQEMRLEHHEAERAGTERALRQLVQHLERGRRSAPDRVRLARATARELRLSEEQIGTIGFAASVHDAGMGRAGGHRTERGGALDASERDAMRRHAEFGAELLDPLSSPQHVRDIVLAHHEWWDGTGYPRGIVGDQIPLGARILAVVDAWESMTVGRAHRPARSRQEAVDELRSLAGRQFDPEVVDAFERALAGLDRRHETNPQDSAPADTRR